MIHLWFNIRYIQVYGWFFFQLKLIGNQNYLMTITIFIQFFVCQQITKLLLNILFQLKLITNENYLNTITTLFQFITPQSKLK